MSEILDCNYSDCILIDDFTDLINLHPNAFSAKFDQGKIYLYVTDNDINLATNVPAKYNNYDVIGVCDKRSNNIFDIELGNNLNKVIRDNLDVLLLNLKNVSGVTGEYKSIRGFVDYSKPVIVVHLKDNLIPEIPKIVYSKDDKNIFFETFVLVNMNSKVL